MSQPIKTRRIRRGTRSSEGSTSPRHMCYRCMRPNSICHCSAIPKIRNKTQIVIAQHIAERSHPFNTARMVAQSLENVAIFSDYPENISRHSTKINRATGLLFPSKNAMDIESIPADERPSKLLLLDGTWNHAKLLYRNWPMLESLAHFKITPAIPGNYRIRLEPNNYSLSTVEAVVHVLRSWEPETSGCEQLISAFETMVDRQLAHPSAEYVGQSSRKKPTRNIPSSIYAPDTKLVYAYGEAEPILKGSPKKTERVPVYWVAKKMTDQTTFKAAIQHDQPLSQKLLDYFQLPESEFQHGLTFDQFRDSWNQFLASDETLVVYNQNTIRLLNSLNIYPTNYIPIKSINFAPLQKYHSLSDYFDANNISRFPADFAGRAGHRLANLITLISHLRSENRRASRLLTE